MLDAKPPKNILDKYSKWVQFLSKSPFGFGWKKVVKKEDLRLMERYQMRTRIWLVGALLPYFVLIIYLNLVIYVA